VYGFPEVWLRLCCRRAVFCGAVFLRGVFAFATPGAPAATPAAHEPRLRCARLRRAPARCRPEGATQRKTSPSPARASKNIGRVCASPAAMPCAGRGRQYSNAEFAAARRRGVLSPQTCRRRSMFTSRQPTYAPPRRPSGDSTRRARRSRHAPRHESDKKRVIRSPRAICHRSAAAHVPRAPAPSRQRRSCRHAVLRIRHAAVSADHAGRSAPARQPGAAMRMPRYARCPHRNAKR